MWLRKLVSFAAPASVALIAFLHAHALGALVDATLSGTAEPPRSIAAFAEARAASGKGHERERAAAPILSRNVFDHLAGPLVAPEIPFAGGDIDPALAPPCDGVRAMVTVRGEDGEGSLAALDVGGKHVLRKHGGEIDNLGVVYIGSDRVWLTRSGRLCQAPVFASASPRPSTPPSQPEGELAGKVVQTGPNEFQVDRGAVQRLVDAPSDWMRIPLVPEKEGDRVVGLRLARIPPSSPLATLGLVQGDRLVSINGIDVTSVERMVEVYARLRTSTLDRLTIHIVRDGRPTNLDYVIR